MLINMTFLVPERKEQHIKNFCTETWTVVEQTFLNPVNAGWKPVKMRSEPSAIFYHIASAPTTSPIFFALAANPSFFPSVSVTATVTLSSTTTSTLACKQAAINLYLLKIYAKVGKPIQTSFKSVLPKKVSRCHGTCHKTITGSNLLSVRLYGNGSLPWGTI